MPQDQKHTTRQSISASQNPPRDHAQDVEGYIAPLAAYGIAVAAGATVVAGTRIYDHYFNVPLLEGIGR